MVAERHLILTLASVARVVDAVGGVEVYLERPMRYTDRAAKLHIDFPAGPLRLSGEEAVKYMRFRTMPWETTPGWTGSRRWWARS